MSYQILKQQVFEKDNFSIIPIRYEDRMDIMKWRNEQMYHLRQNKHLTIEDQNSYFDNIVSKLFGVEKPDQILFSFLENNVCIGYGGLVHINWFDKNAEISFIMQTTLEDGRFYEIWSKFLNLIEDVAFNNLYLQKIYTYAFDIRPHLFKMLSKENYIEEARLKEHCFFDFKYIDVLIHSKVNQVLTLRTASIEDINITFDWATNKIIRQHSIQNEEISFINHSDWFLNKINSKDCVYFIAVINKIPIGSIRFDIINNKEALLSYLLDPQFHGKGFGKKILQKGCEKLLKIKEISKIVGSVSIENIPSLKIFKSLGFQEEIVIDSYINFGKKIKK